jgi:hypothetical protein
MTVPTSGDATKPDGRHADSVTRIDPDRVSRSIDAMVVGHTTADECYRASVTVCAVLGRRGESVRTMREILACLGLVDDPGDGMLA